MQYVTDTFGFDGGRQVTACVPPEPPDAMILTGDGHLAAEWAETLKASSAAPILLVGVHRAADETQRLHEYSPGFDPQRFAAHEKFCVQIVGEWVRSRFGMSFPKDRTAIFGVSAGAELALALGLRHPDMFGAVFAASPGGGYRPSGTLPPILPLVYLVAGTQEPFFLKNAARWADALRHAKAECVMAEREGTHGGLFWRTELPLMAAWAFSRER